MIEVRLVYLFMSAFVLLAIGAAMGASLVHFVANWQLKKMRKNVQADIAPLFEEQQRYNLMQGDVNHGEIVGPIMVGSREISVEEMAALINGDLDPDDLKVEINDPQPEDPKIPWLKKRPKWGQW